MAVRAYWGPLTAAEIAGEIGVKMQTIYWLWWKARKAGKLPRKTRPVGGF